MFSIDTIVCQYRNVCASANNKKKCAECTNNKRRNFVKDYFQKANDKPMPETCPPLFYSGPAEQTEGYECPVCGGFTNPYQVQNSLCKHCGYKLNISR